jgi:hypothetical protein
MRSNGKICLPTSDPFRPSTKKRDGWALVAIQDLYLMAILALVVQEAGTDPLQDDE